MRLVQITKETWAVYEGSVQVFVGTRDECVEYRKEVIESRY
ncbi:hypothetical protein [Mongoliitalea daihaiensis]|nr:hypothetical protein [Mongoliitalea daihaiensis]